MASSSAKITLTYPLYACDFDPNDETRLIVGGGGGAGRSGVGNKITLLDTSNPGELQASAEVELSRDEDNVTSLTAGQRKGKSTMVYAGINSSPDDQKKGNNQHFRVFGVDHPPNRNSKAAATGPKIVELSRSSFFSNKDTDAYQRVTRISAPFAGYPQIGAVATGLAKQSQIAIFEAPATGASPKLRGKLDLDKEAADLDVTQTSEDEYQLVYCDDYEIHSLRIPGGKGSGSTGEPHLIYTVPHDNATGAPRPSFRALRYLTPHFLMAVRNLPKRSGAVLSGFRLPAPGHAPSGPARLSISAKLPKHVAQTTALAVVNLNPPSTPGAPAGDTQFVIAVAGVDCSITLYTLEHQTVSSVEFLSKLYPFATLKGVHPHPISGLSFSNFHPRGFSSSSSAVISPASSPAKSSKSTNSPVTPPSSTSSGPPHLKLASISVANTAVVHTIPLKKLPLPSSSPSSRQSQKRAGGPPRPRQPGRYVVAARSRGPSPKGLLIAFTVGVALIAAILQAFLEIKGLTPTPVLGVTKIVPTSWLSSHAKSLLVRLGESSGSGADGATSFVLREGQGGEDILVSRHTTGEGSDDELGGPDQTAAEQPPVAWEELPVAQKAAWKDRLKAAGHWGEEMGEAIFKGILFTELGGVVGDFVRG